MSVFLGVIIQLDVYKSHKFGATTCEPLFPSMVCRKKWSPYFLRHHSICCSLSHHPEVGSIFSLSGEEQEQQMYLFCSYLIMRVSIVSAVHWKFVYLESCPQADNDAPSLICGRNVSCSFENGGKLTRSGVAKTT